MEVVTVSCFSFHEKSQYFEKKFRFEEITGVWPHSTYRSTRKFFDYPGIAQKYTGSQVDSEMEAVETRAHLINGFMANKSLIFNIFQRAKSFMRWLPV